MTTIIAFIDQLAIGFYFLIAAAILFALHRFSRLGRRTSIILL